MSATRDFLCAKFCQNVKNKYRRRIFCLNISLKKNHEISPHLDYDFSLGAFLKLFKKLFIKCLHLMVNPSWNASQ